MAKYIVKRILLSIFILFGVSVIIYVLIRMLPDNYVETKFASQLANGEITRDKLTDMMKIYGLSDSIFVGYFKWLGNTLTGDLGFSFQYQMPVMDVMKDSMWVSFWIALVSLVLQLAISIPLGIHAAVKQYSLFDYTTTTLTMLGISLPSFFFSGLAIKVFAVDFGWFDTSLGMVSPDLPIDASGFTVFMDQVWHLILPIAVMTILSIGGLMRHTRTNTLEVMNSDYIRTARAKGLSERAVVYKHAFRNTMVPLVTMMASILPSLFGGAMIVEQIFAIPGIGNKAYAALKAGDLPFVMSYNMFLAILTVIGILLSDLMYAVVDPRVKLAK